MTGMETSNLTKEKLRKMFAEGKRFDGRELLESRDFEIEYDVSNKAEGSARIKMGKTDVIVGVKMQVGEPYPDSPDEGNLMVSSDLLPMASPRYESGPPKFDAIELPRLVDRAIRASDIIDFKKLVIEEGKKVWTIVADIYPINDDGNIIEASSLAALAALKNAVFPEIDKEGKVDYDKKTKNKLPLAKEIIPISFSFYKLGDSIILDPTREEEEACDARITFGISNWNKQIMLNSCQKKGKAILTSEEIEKIMEIIPKKFEEFNKKLKKFL
ncbi:exosome complex protein Rrp42 [Candidatus Pacearchaeota archaeon]|nr:exosome complex protein Rrp42 [Candidatus Pacearchaeota archaeon]